MSEELKNIVKDLLEESSHFNINDVLVNANEDNKKLFFTTNLQVSLVDFPKRIINEAKKTIKETGVNPLCLASDFIQVKSNSKNVNCPVFLSPLEYSIDKVRGSINFTHEVGNVFFNPFFIKHLKKELNLDHNLPDPAEREQTIDWLENHGLKLIDGHSNVIGNFHHHRFQIVKELEEIIKNDDFATGIRSILLGEKEDKLEVRIPRDILLPSDTDHNKVYDNVKGANTVIQGPPGTGKSQVLVNLIVKFLSTNNTSIVVSEKRVALEVLVKKLSDFGLDKFCFIASSDNLSSTFLQELKRTWDYLDSGSFSQVNNLRLSEQYLDNLQMTLDLISQKELIGGISFHQFQKLSKGIDLDKEKFVSEVTDLSKFIEYENTLIEIYNQQLFSSLGKLKIETINGDIFNRFDQEIDAWISQLNELKSHLNFVTWSDFDLLKKEAAICQVFENDYYKKYRSLFKPNSTAQKRFLSLRKKHLKASVEIKGIHKNSSQWKVNLSKQETLSLLKQVENATFFSKFKTKKRWQEVSTIPFEDAREELQVHLDNIDKVDNYSKITIDFCELGLESPENDIPIIYQTLHAYSENEWSEIANFPKEKQLLLTSSHGKLRDLHNELKTYFRFDSMDDVLNYLIELRKNLRAVLLLKERIGQLDNKTLLGFGRNGDFDQFRGEMFGSHWTKFKRQFPALSEFNMEDIKLKVNDVISAQKSEAILFAESIEKRIHSTFMDFNELLTIPARKLSEELKAKKVRLRKGKAILIKEFSKTRSHPSLRELYNSEAKEWIQLLKPIWLSNPTQLAKCFPMEKGLFDVAIFDEASQIPLQNAIGTIQRSKRIIVAGDEHQMGPSNYFSTGSSEQVDLLHQSNYYWNKVDLKHHYRSLHPDLISFSNKHFYQNELKAFPAYDNPTPLNYYYCSGGVFEERKNIIEAKEIALLIKKTLELKESIGVVAFSEEQLGCIWDQLTPAVQSDFNERIEENKGFFKSLENVQGDECDHLIIGFGYAKNSENEFHMRFGPMNTSNGRKRLNVLLTRARKRLHFFSSVKSSDFKLSENESINLLKKWMLFIEEAANEDSISFPFGLNPNISKNELTFSEIQNHGLAAEEIVTLHQVLESRGWKIKFS